MSNYPRINWWFGNLYPYESIISFVSRFCSLNYINPRQLNRYLNINLTRSPILSDEEIKGVAEILGDDINIVRTVFSKIETNIFPLIYRPILTKRHRHLRFCGACLRFGYHSNLHELDWITKCPLHLCELKTVAIASNGVILELQVDVLEKLMRENCSIWPCNSEDLFFISKIENIYSVERWIREANAAAIKFGKIKIWSSNPGMGSGSPLSQTFGQLKSLKIPPKNVENIFSIYRQKWYSNYQKFSINVRDELLKNTSCNSIEDLYYLYKYFTALSDNKSPFGKKLQTAQKIIKDRHSICKCTWILMQEGWDSHWVKINPRKRPTSGIRCPYEDAIHQLELGWGRHDVALSRQKFMNSRIQNLQLAISVEHLGLFRRLTDMKDIYRTHIKWNSESPLSELFNSMAECEILEHLRNMENWLNFIERGGHPGIEEWNRHCVQLFVTDEGLALVSWTAEPNTFC